MNSAKRIHEGPAMIPQHILDGLGPDDRVAVLARDGELHFLVHSATASAAEVQAYADRDGSEVVTSHLRDKKEILALVAGRERDVGGEG
jgi:hypothetical protein